MLSRHLLNIGRLRWALLIGFGTSLAIELTQVTAVWGLFPCNYRLFDVDDLLANTLGAVIGFMAAPVLRHLPGQDGDLAGSKRIVTRRRRFVGMAADVLSVFVISYALFAVVIIIDSLDQPISFPAWGLSIFIAVTAVLLLLVVPLRSRGATPGQLITVVRPVSQGGSDATARQSALRFLVGSGGYCLVQAPSNLPGFGWLNQIGAAWLVATIAVVQRRGHRDGCRPHRGERTHLRVRRRRSRPRPPRTPADGRGLTRCAFGAVVLSTRQRHRDDSP